MRILLAPDKFKGCLTALEVAHAMAEGILRVNTEAQIDLCPMADGGEGTVSALVAATNGKLLTRRVTGPLPEMKVDATFGMLGDGQTAVVEMAAASGLALLPISQRDPMATTTFGTGELLMAAAEAGAKRIILGIGGSATVDGGVGCAQACGLPVLLEDGEPVSPTEPLCGRDLDSILMIKHGRGSPVERMQITVACDVVNPLFGRNGAAVVFGPQKGATPQQVKQLDDSLRRLAERTDKLQAASAPGAGAAGGLGFGMLAWFGATLASGVQTVLDAVDLQSRLRQADLCITGEGKLDEQTLHGKTPIGVARAAKRAGIPCIALAGSLGAMSEAFRAKGLNAWFSVCPGPMTLEQSMSDARRLLADAAANAVALFKVHHSDKRG